MYKNIMFDLDGTVTDSGRAIISSVEYALSHFGYVDQPGGKLRTFIGPSLYDSFVREYGMNDDDCMRATELYRSVYENKNMYDVDIYEGIPELIKKLKAEGKTVLLITSKPLVFTEKIIDHIGLGKYFDDLVGPDLNDHSSEKKRLIERAIKNHDLVRSECIMIGDTVYDIEGSVGADIDSIAVTYGYGIESDLLRAGATYIAHDANDIYRIVSADQ